MPTADFSSWTPPDALAATVLRWCSGEFPTCRSPQLSLPSRRLCPPAGDKAPANGALVKVCTKSGALQTEVAQHAY